MISVSDLTSSNDPISMLRANTCEKSAAIFEKSTYKVHKAFGKKLVKMVSKITTSGLLWRALSKLEELIPTKRSRDSVMKRIIALVEMQTQLKVALWITTYSTTNKRLPIRSNSQRHVTFSL